MGRLQRARARICPSIGLPNGAESLDNLFIARGSQVARRAVDADELREHLNHAAGSDPTRDVDRQAFAGPLVDDRQALERLPVGAGIEHEVVRPHVVLCGRRQRPGPSGGHPCAGDAAAGPAAPPDARGDASDRCSSRVPPVSERSGSGDTRSGDTGPPGGASRPGRARPAPPSRDW